MAQYGKYFEYNGKNSSDFGVVLCGFEQIDDIPLGLTRSINKGEINQYRVRANHFGAKYDDVLQFEVSIVKEFCKNRNADPNFTRSEVREISKWLTAPVLPKLFHMEDYYVDTEDGRIYRDKFLDDHTIDYFGLVTDITDTVIDGIVGLKFTFTCDCPFGYSQEITKKLNDGENIIINTSDNEEGYIYPIINIYPHSAGVYTIANDSDHKVSETTNTSLYTMQIDTNKIFTNHTYYEIDTTKLVFREKDDFGNTLDVMKLMDIGITDAERFYWLKLLQGENKIVVSGDADFELVYREYRKVGAY